MRAILIVRLGALGDIIHTLPMAAALRARFPDAVIDWVVDERHRDVLDLVPILNRRIVLRTRSAPLATRLTELRRTLVRERYDVAIDVQGLLKSSVVARLSGAGRVLGFSFAHLRERSASVFYTERHDPGDARAHIIDKNLTLAGALGADVSQISFPLEVPRVALQETVPHGASGGAYAVLNPGAGWPNKRWPRERFSAVARWLRDSPGLRSVVTWGPGDEALARAVVDGAGGAAELCLSTTIPELAGVLRQARLVVAGDTGPAHLAAALGTPVVGLYGPTDPTRNGPWLPDDVTVSRFSTCQCCYRRRCRVTRWCLGEVGIDEVTSAITERLEA